MKWMQMDREEKYFTEQNVYSLKHNSITTKLHVYWAYWGYCLVPKKVIDNTPKCKGPKAPISCQHPHTIQSKSFAVP